MSLATTIARVLSSTQRGAVHAARVTAGVAAQSLSGLKNLMRSPAMGKLFKGSKIAAVEWWTADTMMALMETIIIDVCGIDIDAVAMESVSKAKDKDGYILIDRLIYHYSHTSFLEIVIVLLFTIRVIYKARKGKVDPKLANVFSSIKGIGYGKKKVITVSQTGMKPSGSRVEVTFDAFTISEITALATLFAAISTEVWDWIAHDLLNHPESKQQTMDPNADSSGGNDMEPSFVKALIASLSSMGSIGLNENESSSSGSTVHSSETVRMVPSQTVSQVVKSISDKDGVANLISQSGKIVDLRSEAAVDEDKHEEERSLADIYGVSVSNLRRLKRWMGVKDDPSI